VRRIRWFQIVSIVLLAFLLVPLSPIIPTKICHSKNNQTLVTLTFDDGYSCWISKVMPILKRYNLTATAFVNTPDYLDRDFTWADIQELHNAGWEIGWHTARHINLATAGQREIIEDFNSCPALFKAHGLPPPLTFAYPGGEHDLTSMKIVSEHFLAARTCHRGVNSPCYVQRHPCHLKMIPLSQSLPSLEEEVNKQSHQGMFIVFFAHTVGQTAEWQDKPEMTVEEFENLAKFLHHEEQKGNIDVVTFKEGVQRMQQQEATLSWGVKLDSPLSPCFDAYGIPVPQRYFTLYKKVIHESIEHRYPQIPQWFDRVILGPVGFSMFLGVIFFVIASIVATTVTLKRKNF